MKPLTHLSRSHANGTFEDIENSLSDLSQHIDDQTIIYALLNSRLTRLHGDVAAGNPIVPIQATSELTAAIHISPEVQA
jgi:hypothetical protein